MMTLIIYGEPYGKQNMKPTTMAGHLRLVQPSANTDYMYRIQSAFMDRYKPVEGLESDDRILYMHITAYFSIPTSVSKKTAAKMAEGKLRPIKKPDCDNISKVVCDALGGLAFRNDSQIVSLTVDKYYTRDNPRVVIKLKTHSEHIEELLETQMCKGCCHYQECYGNDNDEHCDEFLEKLEKMENGE